MDENERKMFEDWAESFDQEVAENDRKGGFPFAGYAKVLNFIAAEIAASPRPGKIRVLDLGIGTGTLESAIPPEKIEVSGIDASEKMLEICRLKLPEANLFEGDFRLGIPEELKTVEFDAIVATYSLHHLDFDEWIEHVHYLSHHLAPFGKIYVGDILFANREEKALCRARFPQEWDEDGTDHYHVVEDLLGKMEDHLAASFLKLSFCAGVLIVENFRECRCFYEEKVRKQETAVKFGKK